MASIFTSWGKKLFGGAGKSIDRSIFGSKSKLQKLPTMDSRTLSLYKNILGNIDPSQLNIAENPAYQQGSDYLSRLLSNEPGAFEQFEAPYMRQFQEQIVPQLAEQFAGLGAQDSSAFQQALGQQSAGLSERLAALRGGMQMQALPQALEYAGAPGRFSIASISQALSHPTFNYMNKQGTPGFLSQLGGGIGQGLGQLGPLALLGLL